MEITFDSLPEAVTQLYDKLNNIERLLLEKSNEPQPEADQLLNIKQAAEFLKLSVPTLYTKVHSATIPVCKQGNRLYFSKQDLINWIRTGRKKTLAETAIEAEQYLKKKGAKVL